MVDFSKLQHEARITTDEHGETVVQIPLTLWQELVKQVAPQHERILALLKQWEAEPDDTLPSWWDEFDKFLAENRVSFVHLERELGDADRLIGVFARNRNAVLVTDNDRDFVHLGVSLENWTL